MDAVTSQKAWDEALERLLAYLAAINAGGVEHRTRVAMHLIEKARRLHANTPDVAPVKVVMDVAATEIEQWFANTLPGPDSSATLGIVAAWMTDAPRRWPDALLAAEPPGELREAFARVTVRTGPDLSLVSMTSREMDYGAMETIAQQTWHQFGWLPILRAAALWTGIFFLALYAYDRFFPQS